MAFEDMRRRVVNALAECAPVAGCCVPLQCCDGAEDARVKEMRDKMIEVFDRNSMVLDSNAPQLTGPDRVLHLETDKDNDGKPVWVQKTMIDFHGRFAVGVTAMLKDHVPWEYRKALL